MYDSSVIIDLYSGDCFDEFVVLFNSRIFAWEFSGYDNEFIARDKF